MAAQGEQWAGIVPMVTEICCNCGVPFGMPIAVREVFLNNPSKSFCCPYGHKQHYTESKCKRDLRIANAKVADLQLSTERLNSVYNGVCPYCQRKYTNLTLHIRAKHRQLVSN